MAKQIFRLHGIPKDEADDIRALLTEHNIDFYETPGGNWGISMPALWLNDVNQEATANLLIKEYQSKRYLKARSDYELLKQQGKQPTIFSTFIQNPAQYIFYLAGIAALIYFTIMPFIDAGKAD
jgi:hypothetical protein